ncbi:MAG TPA: right-handed parallel beta-helix repeat-containing protein [Nitrososphaeraceae archaeon]|nr:right-handed parallel beta-helix repeat-containing protein [Nitrososphaeraceae archaeon]
MLDKRNVILTLYNHHLILANKYRHVTFNIIIEKLVSSYNTKAVAATLLGTRKLQLLILIMIIIIYQWPSVIPFLQKTLSYYIQNASAQQQYTESDSCITYDPADNIIRISCSHTDLTRINNQLNDPDILHKETTDGVWLLNAGIIIEQNATLYINSTDTSWMKIAADGETAYPILVSGSLKIDSVKVTSWNPNTNDYALTNNSDRNGRDTQIGTPRPYIIVETVATGTMDITNSEIAYLGYEGGYGAGRTGLRYLGGDGSMIKGNNIHNMWFGFYSKGVGGIVIEDNHIHHNGHYGLDPHTGTYDMIIRNNTVHDNGSTGIICSLDCYNITIENNNVYNNTKYSIMFSRNMTDSIARNNVVSNEDNGIVISESHNNEVYNNIVSDSGSGIDIDEDSFENVVYNNTIINIPDPSEALHLRDGASEQNTLHSNTLITINGEKRISLDVEQE